MRWEGCAPPLGTLGAPCQPYHGQAVPARPIWCLAWQARFVRVWAQAWGEWPDIARHYHRRRCAARPQASDRPQSFAESIPEKAKTAPANWVSGHQYPMLHAVTPCEEPCPCHRDQDRQQLRFGLCPKVHGMTDSFCGK